MRRTPLFLSLLAAVAVAVGCDSGTATAPAEPASRATASSTNQPPVAKVNLTVLGTWFCELGTCAYHYEYDAYESYDPDGSIVDYQWIENGVVVATGPTYQVSALRAYEGCGGTQEGTLVVTDDQGATGSACYGYTPVE